jgi:hypothetical protein
MIKFKQCIICDKLLSQSNDNNYKYYAFTTNHYLCSSDCSIKYIEISYWNKELNHFMPNMVRLNLYRLKVKNIKELTLEDLKYRSDKE